MKNNGVMNGSRHKLNRYLSEYAGLHTEPRKVEGVFDEAREFISDFRRSAHEKGIIFIG